MRSSEIRIGEIVRNAVAFNFKNSGEEILNVPCATVEGLLLLKLYALPSLYRQGSFAIVGLYENDVATLIQAYRPALESLLEELSGHLRPDDLAAVRGIVSDIQGRIERFQRESGGEDREGS